MVKKQEISETQQKRIDSIIQKWLEYSSPPPKPRKKTQSKVIKRIRVYNKLRVSAQKRSNRSISKYYADSDAKENFST